MFGFKKKHVWGNWDQFQKNFIRIASRDNYAEIWQVRKCKECGKAEEMFMSNGYISAWENKNG